jgi:two-component system sensor histidine kinase AtoS
MAGMARGLKEQKARREEAYRRAFQAERKLAQSERLASIGQLAAGLAHELNNPLTVIQGAAQVIPKSGSEDLKGWTEDIVQETQRCKRLIGDLLNLSKPLDLKVQKTDLASLCREAWNQVVLGRQLGARLVLRGGSPSGRVDPGRFKQVLINLISNSLDAMDDQGVVTMSWERKRGKLRFSVQDSGPGFTARDPAEPFRPFYTTKPSGTGLGLAICRSIVEAHGGSIWAAPTRGRGAAIILELPA